MAALVNIWVASTLSSMLITVLGPNILAEHYQSQDETVLFPYIWMGERVREGLGAFSFLGALWLVYWLVGDLYEWITIAQSYLAHRIIAKTIALLLATSCCGAMIFLEFYDRSCDSSESPNEPLFKNAGPVVLDILWQLATAYVGFILPFAVLQVIPFSLTRTRESTYGDNISYGLFDLFLTVLAPRISASEFFESHVPRAIGLVCVWIVKTITPAITFWVLIRNAPETVDVVGEALDQWRTRVDSGKRIVTKSTCIHVSLTFVGIYCLLHNTVSLDNSLPVNIAAGVLYVFRGILLFAAYSMAPAIY
ncbi:hypothetical protein C8R43DRAFT_1053102 [Mycena crocata]|nr:hypothetical protein C8R43DRAFT_1053102 [Mycena crocata]